MKKHFTLLLSTVLLCTLLFGCGKKGTTPATTIALSDTEILVDGVAVSSQDSAAVYAANDIVYYEQDRDFTYGEGSESDAHSKEEAINHTVVHITKPGTYRLCGTLSAGQIAVDLGKDAKNKSSAVVTLVLDNAHITCTVAPAIIFYNVYECNDDDEDSATATVNTTKAGANIVLADGSHNTVNGSYVAKIYKSYTLNTDGTEVVDSKKLHKYDGAVYSKMTMNVSGEKKGNGTLAITAQNEGLDSERHLTLNGGVINIVSENDGINTNEDGISVTTINGGTLNITISSTAAEGDGIDSNGWLVINGGTVNAFACGRSMDSGIDSDNGIHLNGGTVVATGNMLDRLSEAKQTFAVFTFSQKQPANTVYTLKNQKGATVLSTTPANAFTYLVVSSANLKPGEYTLYSGDVALSVAQSGSGGGRPSFGQGGTPPQMPEGGFERPDFGGERPSFGGQPPQGGFERPDFGGETPPQKPNDNADSFGGATPQNPENGGFGGFAPGTQNTASTTFTLANGANYFSVS